MLELNQIYHLDCMLGMNGFPDKFFELAIVDPPYGEGQHFNFRFDAVYKNDKPENEYFKELFRVSKNQIIWGGNYFSLPISRCWITWIKNNPVPNFSDFELAWTSFDKVSKLIKLTSYGFNHPDKKNGEKTIHPTQKPVYLYMELLRRYASPGDKILDTHGGSFSSIIACIDGGFEYIGFELDKDYYNAAIKRIENHKAQLRLHLF